MRFFAYHGLLPEERSQGQSFEVDVELYFCPPEKAIRTDDIQETIDYRQVYQDIREIVEEQQYRLLETLAERLASSLLNKYSVTGVTIRVRKPEVSLPGPLNWAGVEIYRRRETVEVPTNFSDPEAEKGISMAASNAREKEELSEWTPAYIGLGSNLGDREAYLWQALGLLAAHPGLRVVKVSSFYETKPVGYQAQGLFINAVARVDTIYSAPKLYQTLKAIENQLGRKREISWGPRTVDLDLLLFGDQIIEEPDLIVPHPYLEVRDFVLVPLAEIAPNLRLPQGSFLPEVIAKLANLKTNLLSKWPSHAKMDRNDDIMMITQDFK